MMLTPIPVASALPPTALMKLRRLAGLLANWFPPSSAEISDHRYCRLPRSRRERQRRRAAEQRDELAALHHSITSSVSTSSVGGISRPSVPLSGASIVHSRRA